MPLPAGHSEPAGIALTFVHEPSQPSGPEKLNESVGCASHVLARNVIVVGGVHVPCIEPHVHDGHPGDGTFKPEY